jgi:8-oxo-dGTP pyrophosphatase MutT (NUDIX family)
MPISPYLRRLREQIGHELIVLPSVTACIPGHDRSLLLVRHSEGPWVAPGGAIEPDERPLDALKRETFEETGLHVHPKSLVGVYGGPEFKVTYRNGDQVSYIMTVYLCEQVDQQPRPDGDEIREVAYFRPPELRNLQLSSWIHTILPDVYSII